MQKIKFINANGDEIDFTSGCYGVTGWKGLSNANLSLQTQKVPDYDGSVYIDGLLENREIELNLVINDGNNLQTRYEKRQELCKKLNPKLGEGYLYYENDAVQRRIKAISETPIIENKNADESGSVKATLVFDCTGVYWEDVEETVVTLKSFEKKTIVNNGDVPCSVKVEADTWNIANYALRNDTQKIQLKNIKEYDKVFIDTLMGQKSVLSEKMKYEIANIGVIFYSVTYSSDLGLFVAVGNSGTILTSPDGVTWTSQTSGVSVGLLGITYSSDLGLFVTMGWNGAILTSPDGTTWTSQTSGTPYDLNGVTYSSDLGLFVAVGDSGTILTSPNGTTWTSRTSGVTNSLNGVTYSSNLGLFVAVGNSGTILTSPDGVTWTSQTSGVSFTLWEIVYSSDLGLFVAVGASGTILTSPDGVTWTSQTSGVATVLYGITYSSDLGLFVAVGNSGTILYSVIISDTNIIDHLTEDSDMTFNLAVGENTLQVTNVSRVFNTRLTYRQRYLGV